MRSANRFTRSCTSLMLALALFLLGMSSRMSIALAESGATAGAPRPNSDVTAPPDSPRASVADYLELCRKQRFTEAAEFLDLSGIEPIRGPELARKLKDVLDTYLWVDLETLSNHPAGNTNDGLPIYMEELGKIPGAVVARPTPIRIRRVEDGKGARWIFTRQTVSQIDAWYEALDGRFLRERLPAPLLKPGPKDLLVWQWLALPVLCLVAWMMGYVLSRLTRHVLSKIVARTQITWDDLLVTKVSQPLTLVWLVVALHALLPVLGLYQPARVFLSLLMRSAIIFAFFWLLFRVVDVGGQLIAKSPWATSHPAGRSLLPIGMRVGKVALLALALVTIISELGYPVASLIAGLGIGGLAFALAAQKTVENLFGAVSLAVDQPFREGDFVKLADFVGTVETVGLRSTRVRTLDRTVITLPNGRLAEMQIESFAVRDRIRFACTIGLVYETTSSQMKAVLSGFEHVLREHPKIWSDAVIVRFKEFGASSLDIEIMAWFQTSDWGEFQLIRQETLLRFMEVVEKAGSAFAFPTRTVHLVTRTVEDAS